MKKNDIIICECHSDEHQIIFKYDTEDENFENVFVSYHLDNLTFWNRIKYLFGYKSKYGAWGELILNPNKETINKLEKVVEYLKKVEKKKKEKEIKYLEGLKK